MTAGRLRTARKRRDHLPVMGKGALRIFVVLLTFGLLCGMAQPPHEVNPLKPDQVDSLRVSGIRCEQHPPGEIDRSWFGKPSNDLVDERRAAILCAAIRARLVERLGPRVVPHGGNATLVVILKGVEWEGSADVPTRAGLHIGARVLLRPNTSAEYSVGGVSASKSALQGEMRNVLAFLARSVADRLINAILSGTPD